MQQVSGSTVEAARRAQGRSRCSPHDARWKRVPVARGSDMRRKPSSCWLVPVECSLHSTSFEARGSYSRTEDRHRLADRRVGAWCRAVRINPCTWRQQREAALAAGSGRAHLRKSGNAGVRSLVGQQKRRGPLFDWDSALIRASRWLSSAQGQLVVWAILVWLVFSGRIGVIFDSFLILFALLSIAPVVGALVLRWWIAANVREGTCPNCRFPVTGLVGKEFRCPSCTQRILVEKNGNFVLSEDARSAVINVEAREVDTKD